MQYVYWWNQIILMLNAYTWYWASKVDGESSSIHELYRVMNMLLGQDVSPTERLSLSAL